MEEKEKPTVIQLLTEWLKADECCQLAGKDRQLPSALPSTGSQVETHKYNVTNFKSLLLTEKHFSFLLQAVVQH